MRCVLIAARGAGSAATSANEAFRIACTSLPTNSWVSAVSCPSRSGFGIAGHHSGRAARRYGQSDGRSGGGLASGQAGAYIDACENSYPNVRLTCTSSKPMATHRLPLLSPTRSGSPGGARVESLDDARERRDLRQIGDLAREAGKTVRAIHLYEELGLLTPAGRSKGRFRLYGRESLVRIRWIGEAPGHGLQSRRHPDGRA